MLTKARWDLAWRDRPPEEASNFNPAFCGEIIYRTAREYSRLREVPFSVALTFLVLPGLLWYLLEGSASVCGPSCRLIVRKR